jgi:hypothetical protein
MRNKMIKRADLKTVETRPPDQVPIAEAVQTLDGAKGNRLVVLDANDLPKRPTSPGQESDCKPASAIVSSATPSPPLMDVGPTRMVKDLLRAAAALVVPYRGDLVSAHGSSSRHVQERRAGQGLG